MLKAHKKRGGSEARKRFCVDCGVQSGHGINRYSTGDRIPIQGQAFVICIRCDKFKTAAPSQEKAVMKCLTCWTRSRQLQEARETAKERARLRTGHDHRRARRRKLAYSDSEDEYSDALHDERLFGPPDWDAYHLALAQSDAFGDWASDFNDIRKLRIGEQARGPSDEEWSRGAGLATVTGVVQIDGRGMAPIDPTIILCRSRS